MRFGIITSLAMGLFLIGGYYEGMATEKNFNCQIRRFTGVEVNYVLTGQVTENKILHDALLVDQDDNDSIIFQRKSVDFDVNFNPRKPLRKSMNRYDIGLGEGDWWHSTYFEIFLPKNILELNGKFRGELAVSTSESGSASRMYCSTR